MIPQTGVNRLQEKTLQEREEGGCAKGMAEDKGAEKEPSDPRSEAGPVRVAETSELSESRSGVAGHEGSAQRAWRFPGPWNRLPGSHTSFPPSWPCGLGPVAHRLCGSSPFPGKDYLS